MSQTYRVEIRFDVTTTPDRIHDIASTVASLVAGLENARHGTGDISDPEVTAIFDEDWEEIT